MKVINSKQYFDYVSHLHDYFYDYSNTIYKKAQAKIIINCPKHGTFSIRAYAHKQGQGCKLCGIEQKKQRQKIKNKHFFVERSTKIHHAKYDYSLVEYKNSHSKVKIICPIHGSFFQRPGQHLRGEGCPMCANTIRKNKKTKTSSQFIVEANKIHKNIYEYSNVNYVNSHSKIEIICTKHGKFFQLPYVHLQGGGCSSCGGTKQFTTKTFVESCNKVHGNKYDYSLVNYKNSHIKVKIKCPFHGEFEMMPYCHRQGQGCPKCGKVSMAKKLTLSQEEFVKRSIEKHKGKYVYDCVEYVKADTKVKIICSNHGPFFQRPAQHMRGEGCPVCGMYSWFAEQGGYSEQMFKRNPEIKNQLGIIYLVKFSTPTEKFLKVGITKRTLDERFHWGYQNYNMEVLLEHFTTLYDAWRKEQLILCQFKNQRYVPMNKIGGWTECLSKYININDVKQLIES